MGKKTEQVGRTIDKSSTGFINKHISHDGKTWYYAFSTLSHSTREYPVVKDRFPTLKQAREAIGKET